MRKPTLVIISLMAGLSLTLAACGPAATPTAPTAAPRPTAVPAKPTAAPQATAIPTEPPAAPQPTAAPTVGAWLDLPLTDARTGDTFKLSDHREHTVILEMMDPSCYVCRTQVTEIASALEAVGHKAMAVSVAIDHKADAAKLVAYADSLKAGWFFAVTTEEFKKALASDFGAGVLSAGSTPVIVIDPSGAPHITKPGIKKSASLVDLVNQVNP